MEFNTKIEYDNKNEVYVNIVNYHHAIQRSFVIKESCKTKYYIKCNVEDCTFKCNFYCSNQHWRNTKFSEHSCYPCASNINIKRMASTKYLSAQPDVINIINTNVKVIKPISFTNQLELKGIKISSKNSSRQLNAIKDKMKCSFQNQFNLLESYVDTMNQKGSPSYLEKCMSGRFKRMMVIFREGINQFRIFFMRGIQFDCTFCKTKVGGTLMLACFKDGNNNIRLIACGLVESENEDSWKWFMTNLKNNLTVLPSFIISDREKGLIKAAMIFENVPHFYCFRHVMANLCLKFKSFKHKIHAWNMVKSESMYSFKITSSTIQEMPEIFEWLKNIGFEKLSIAYSPVSRYNTVTSNNVESLNARIKNIRQMDPLDIFMELERMVIKDRSSSLETCETSDFLTKFAQRILSKQVELSYGRTVTKLDENYYIVSADIERRVFHGNFTSCTCGLYSNMRIPCCHIITVFKSINKDFNSLCCDSWKISAHVDAYGNRNIQNEPTIITDLDENYLQTPMYSVKRGRPRKSRIESQFSLLRKASSAKRSRVTKSSG